MTFQYINHVLHAESCKIPELVKRYQTPLYIYSRKILEDNFHRFENYIKPYQGEIFYAAKANSNLAILSLLVRMGAGFEVVSRGEYERVLKAGADAASKVIYSGLAKKESDIKAMLKTGIYAFHIESMREFKVIERVAKALHLKAPISIRLNPEIDVSTHPYLKTASTESKFGLIKEEVLSLYKEASSSPYLIIRGLNCHLGSNISDVEPYLQAFYRLLPICHYLADLKAKISYLDIGGGFDLNFGQKIESLMVDIRQQLPTTIKLIIEPGRALVGSTGLLVTKVIDVKKRLGKNILITDVGMNDFIRPSLYHAEHACIPVVKKEDETIVFDIAGPICESGDYVAKNRSLNVKVGDLLAIEQAGAYGFVMSSNYNARPRAAEVVVDKEKHYLVRKRETITSLMKGEICIDT